MIPISKVPTFVVLKIEDKNYRVPELDSKTTQSYFATSNSWVAKQQGINSKNKNFQKNRTNVKVYQDIVQRHNGSQAEQTNNNNEQLNQPVKVEVTRQLYQVKQSTTQQQQIQTQPKEIQTQSQQIQDQSPPIKQQSNEAKIQDQGSPDNQNYQDVQDDSYSHFISLPIYEQELTTKLYNLQKEFIGLEPGLKKYPIDTRKAHINILHLKLNNQKKIDRAKLVLKNLDELIQETLNNKGLTINFQGLGVFGKGPRQAKSLYLKAQLRSSQLQQVFHIVVKEFLKSKLISDSDISHYKMNKDNYEADLIYVTLFQIEEDNNQIFDASSIIQAQRNIDVGQYQIRRMDLSDKNAYDSNGFHMPIGTIKL